MTLYTVTTNYMNNYFFGNYSSILNARNAIINFFDATDELLFCEYVGNYAYRMTDKYGENYWFEIVINDIDKD